MLTIEIKIEIIDKTAQKSAKIFWRITMLKEFRQQGGVERISRTSLSQADAQQSAVANYLVANGSAFITNAELQKADPQKEAVSNLMIANGAKSWSCGLQPVNAQEAHNMISFIDTHDALMKKTQKTMG